MHAAFIIKWQTAFSTSTGQTGS